MSATTNVVLSGRNENGTFARGHVAYKNGGRPRGLDLRAACEELAERDGVDLKEAMWKIMKGMITLATNGDLGAAKLVITTLCDAPQLEAMGESLAATIAATLQSRVA